MAGRATVHLTSTEGTVDIQSTLFPQDLKWDMQSWDFGSVKGTFIFNLKAL